MTLDLNKYFNLLKCTQLDVEYFLVMDSAGKSIREEGCGDSMNLFRDCIERFDEGNNVYCCTAENNKLRYRIEIKSFSGIVVASAIFIVNSDYLIALPVLINAVESIESEMNMLDEMDGMALELSDRYNELNLIYEADDYLFNNVDGKAVLEKLVSQCADYMDIQCVMLYMPEKNIVIQSKKPQLANTDVSEVFYQIKTDLYEWNRQSAQPVVLNTEQDYLDAGFINYAKVKLLSCPIKVRDSKIMGILVCARSFTTDRDFTNSDKNLLDAMVTRVSKVMQSSIDDLTGLITRSGFETCLHTALSRLKHSSKVSSLLSIDIDQMQIINDVAGQEAGDALIYKVAQLLEGEVSENDRLARLSGDIFVILLGDSEVREAQDIAERIRDKISNFKYMWATTQFDISVSIGVVEINQDTSHSDAAISCAEIACKTAKEAGRNCVRVYHNQDLEVIKRKTLIYWANHVRQALREDRFELYAQRILPLHIKEDFHCEILMRMLDESGNVLVPGQFMPAAEQYVLMPLIDRWVVKNTLASIKTSMDDLRGKKGHIAINISGQSIGQDGFTEFLLDSVRGSGLDANMICFEITETAAIKNLHHAQDMISALKKLGCQFSLDDFGTGLSSFTYLKQLSVDFLKIDGSFVKEIVDDHISRAMVSAIISVAQAMKIKTIAEFVENDEIKDMLEDMGVDYVQGYGIGKPIPLGEQIALFSEDKNMASNDVAVSHHGLTK